ncbi:MAG TPA: LysR family transcriptional regulator [Acetobacteraceae bacterium]|nr:LysR family transcriptional regulator [Acetobacteraceae bacterium]
MDLLSGMRLFARVVETGGFTVVARESNTSQPTISRTIASLEAHLGVRLLNRSSRALTLTDDGRQFYERARDALEAVAEAENSVGRRRGEPSGLLRLGTPVAFGRLHVAPRMPAFLARHKEVNVDLVMSDAFVDLVGEGLDLAIRVGDLADPSLIARAIGMTRRVTVAATSYLEARGVPSTPAELAHHDCVIYTRLATGQRWYFDSSNGPVRVDVAGRFRADNSEAVREAVIGGAGIAVLPVWLFSDEIERGLVRVILEQYEPTRLPIHAVYPSRRLLAAKVRAMIDFLALEFEKVRLLSIG